MKPEQGDFVALLRIVNTILKPRSLWCFVSAPALFDYPNPYMGMVEVGNMLFPPGVPCPLSYETTTVN